MKSRSVHFIALALLVGLSSGLSLSAAEEMAAAASASAQITALDRVIMIRTASDGKVYGENEVDPLLWSESTYFLQGESRTRLLAALETVSALPDSAVRQCPPAQRALVQSRVWRVFDHVQASTASRTRADRDYLQALARAMARLALDSEEIAAIPDSLGLAARSGRWPTEPGSRGGPDIFMPADFTETGGRWVYLGREESGMIASHHSQQLGNRSLFLVGVRFPEGSISPTAYFKSLAEFPTPWLAKDSHEQELNAKVPELPAHADFALIRRLAVIDREGRWQATPLTLSLQLRHYRVTSRQEWASLLAKIVPGDDSKPSERLQSFAEFELETSAVAEGRSSTFRAVRADESQFRFVFAHGFDHIDGAGVVWPGFKPGPDAPAMACTQCHGGLGLKSVNTVMFFSTSFKLPRLVSRTVAEEASKTAAGKMQQEDWGALQAFWPASEVPLAVH